MQALFHRWAKSVIIIQVRKADFLEYEGIGPHVLVCMITPGLNDSFPYVAS